MVQIATKKKKKKTQNTVPLFIITSMKDGLKVTFFLNSLRRFDRGTSDVTHHYYTQLPLLHKQLR